ncbi:MAG: DUF3772 domain-containing protein [Paracoccaceae bacterium]
MATISLPSAWGPWGRARLAGLFGLMLALCLWAVAGWAQTTENVQIDYNRWSAVAETAEALIENPNATEEALTNIRNEVSNIRAQFVAAREVLATRVVSVQEQITALGPVPADGQAEAAEIAARRAELNTLLTEREAPLRAADEAFARAEVIIRNIDSELRARQANALMELGPSPLNPTTWLAALETMIASAKTLIGEPIDAWADPAKYEAFISDLPVTIFLLALALLMLLRGRRWMEQLTMRLLQSTAILRGRVVAAFFMSLSQLLVPALGLILLAIALTLTSLVGPKLENLSTQFVAAGMDVVLARWLSLHVFPIVDDPRQFPNLNAEQRRRARVVALLLGMTSGLLTLFDAVFVTTPSPVTAKPALMLPLVIFGAFGLFRLGRILSQHVANSTGGDEPPMFGDRMIRLGAKVMQVLALVSPILGLAGYMNAAENLVFPAIDSVAIVGFAMVLHRLVTAIYTAIVGEDETKADGLVPALAGLLLALAAVVPLALTWGARETDLWEIWNRFSAGIQLGEARLSPTNILLFFVVFAIGYLVTRGLQGALGVSVLPKTSMEKGAQKALVSGVGYVGITTAALVAFSTAGIDLSGLAIVAGALSVGIGFGLQNIVSNFVSGIILLIERPVSEGDWVEVGTTSGIIQRISVRSTMIETFDRSKVIVPNADLISGAVTNFTKSSKTGRMIVPVGVAYGTDTRKVEQILLDIVKAEPLVVVDPGPSVLLMRFGADAIEFEIRAILRDVNFKMSIASEINHKIAARFAEEGIEIPYAQRDIWLRNPEALLQTSRPTAPAAPTPAVEAPQPKPDRDTDTASESPDQTDDDFTPRTR